MNELKICGIECFAFHGCLPEEALIGCKYRIDVSFFGDFKKAMETDNLADAVDYVLVNEVVKKEMAVRSQLIEHVAGRILSALKKKFTQSEKIVVSVSKLNPPVKGFIGEAIVCIEG